MKLIVTAGYGRSLHAIALVHELARRGHRVVACLEVSTLNVRRARGYLRQLGWRRLAAKARARLGPAAGAGAMAAEVAPMRAFLDAHRITSRTVRAACTAVGASHLSVDSLNGKDALRALRHGAPDMVVYAGGGIVGKRFLESAGQGVLNVHGGPLPAFRGMNAAEWAVLHGVAPACVAHWMEPAVDTGPILASRGVPLGGIRTVPALRGLLTRVTVELMLDTVDAIAGGAARAAPQRVGDGRLFHVMAPPLLEAVERRLAGGFPLASPDTFRFGATPASAPA